MPLGHRAQGRGPARTAQERPNPSKLNPSKPQCKRVNRGATVGRAVRIERGRWPARGLAAFLAVATCGAGLALASGAAGAASTVPGVTKKTITVGNVSVLSGPVPGLFQGAPYGVTSYFAYVNSKGGVNGRKLKMTGGDTGYSCSQNLSTTQAMASSVFAFVGDFSIFTNCSKTVFAKTKTLPDVSDVLTPTMLNLPNVFGIDPQLLGQEEGFFKWVRQTYPKAKKVGTIYTNNPGAAVSWKDQKQMMEALGFTVAFTAAYTASQTTFTSDIIRMRDAGVQFLEEQEATVATFARLMNNANTQGWKPTVVASSTAYTANFTKLIQGSAGTGALVNSPYQPYLQKNSKVKSVKLFQEWNNKIHPGANVNLFTAAGWVSAQLFVDALKKAGKNPTRKSLYHALKTINRFTGTGMTPPFNPAKNGPETCYLVLQYKSHAWSVLTPKKGFRCNPGGYYFITPKTAKIHPPAS